MGKGDKSTKRGKIFAGSYGNSRRHNEGKSASTNTSAVKPVRSVATKAPTKAAPRKKA